MPNWFLEFQDDWNYLVYKAPIGSKIYYFTMLPLALTILLISSVGLVIALFRLFWHA